MMCLAMFWSERFIFNQMFSVILMSGDCRPCDGMYIVIYLKFTSNPCSVYGCIVILEKVKVIRKMPCYSWPQVFVEFVNILLSSYVAFNKTQSLNTIISYASPHYNCNSTLTGVGGTCAEVDKPLLPFSRHKLCDFHQ